MADRHFSLVVEYDGTDFQGWQRQAPGVPTVQGTLEGSLRRILAREVTVRGAGRTDRGVHALGQWATFSTDTDRPLADLRRGLQAVLPGSVRVVRLDEACRRLDALRESTRKTYFYQYHCGEHLPPLRRRWFAWGGRRLALEPMREAARHLEGRHDFTAFVNEAGRHRTCVRDLHRVRIQRLPAGLRLYFTAPGFLYNMVRTLAAGLCEVGTGRWSPEDLRRVLASGERRHGPVTAPPEGLFLFRVDWSGSVADSLRSREGSVPTTALP